MEEPGRGDGSGCSLHPGGLAARDRTGDHRVRAADWRVGPRGSAGNAAGSRTATPRRNGAHAARRPRPNACAIGDRCIGRCAAHRGRSELPRAGLDQLDLVPVRILHERDHGGPALDRPGSRVTLPPAARIRSQVSATSSTPGRCARTRFRGRTPTLRSCRSARARPRHSCCRPGRRRRQACTSDRGDRWCAGGPCRSCWCRSRWSVEGRPPEASCAVAACWFSVDEGAAG